MSELYVSSTGELCINLWQYKPKGSKLKVFEVVGFNEDGSLKKVEIG